MSVEVTEEMVDMAMAVLCEEMEMPYMARVRDFTKEEVRAGLLSRADEEADQRNRDLVRRALEAALTTGE